MAIRAWLGSMMVLLFSGVAVAGDFDRSELPDSAYTVGKGKFQVHADGYQSSVGVTDFLDVRTRIIPSIFGFNVQAKVAAIQKEDWAFSLEPLIWTEWPGANLGFPSYTLGVMSRYSRSFGKHRFNFGWGVKYDVLKVTIRPLDSDGDGTPDHEDGAEFVEGKGIEIQYEYSKNIVHAPMRFHEDATKTDDGWDFRGIRMPIVIGYELHTNEGEAFNLVARIRPLAIANGGSWYVEIHPSYNKAVGERFRFGFGVNVLAPGLPFPIADEELNAEIEAHKAGNEEDFQSFMNKIPQAGWAVFVVPTVGLWWRI